MCPTSWISREHVLGVAHGQTRDSMHQPVVLFTKMESRGSILIGCPKHASHSASVAAQRANQRPVWGGLPEVTGNHWRISDRSDRISSMERSVNEPRDCYAIAGSKSQLQVQNHDRKVAIHLPHGEHKSCRRYVAVTSEVLWCYISRDRVVTLSSLSFFGL
jgi:hypothetical protein